MSRNGWECPQAHVVRKGPHITEESIMQFMNSRLSDYKRLAGGIVFREAIPKSASGKILRRTIEDPYAKQPTLSKL